MLTYTDALGFRLSLRGLSSQLPQREVPPPSGPIVILGLPGPGASMVRDGHSANLMQPVSLWDVGRLSASHAGPKRGLANAEYFANRVLIGRHLREPGSVKFSRVEIRIDQLRDWLPLTGFRNGRAQSQSGHESMRYVAPPELRAPFLDGEVKLSVNLSGITMGMRERTYVEDAWVVFSGGRRSLEQVENEIVRPIADFLTLMMGRGSLVTSVVLSMRPVGNAARGPDFRSVQVLSWETDRRPQGRSRFLAPDGCTPFSSVRRRLGTVLSHWVRLNREAPAALHAWLRRDYDGSQATDEAFLSAASSFDSLHGYSVPIPSTIQARERGRMTRILAHASVDDAEWFRRRFGSSVPRWSASQRLGAAVERYGPILGDALKGREKRFVARCVELRNRLAHPSKAGLSGTEVFGMAILAPMLRCLGRAVLLSELGFTDRTIAKAIRRSADYFHGGLTTEALDEALGVR